MASPPVQQRATGDRGTTERGTEGKAIGSKERTLGQEEPYASRPGPLARMMQVVSGLQKTVVLYAPSFADKARLYAEARYPADADVLPASNWEDVLSQLKGRSAIGRLVLFVEGTPGYFFFDRLPSGRLVSSPVSLKVAGETVKALQKKPVLTAVELEGCNMGGQLESVKDFGLALGASEISAINQYHFFGLLRIRGSPKDTSQMERDVAAYADFIATPNVRGWLALAKTRAIDRVLLIEWYTSDFQLAGRTLPSDPKKRQGFSSRRDLRLEVVAAPGELQSIQDSIDRDPRPSHVRILLESFSVASRK